MAERPPRIHIVDDEEPVRQSLAFLLELNGFAVIVWASAAALLEGIAADPADCLITDLRMPDMDGVDLLRRLGERGDLPPAVVMTGHGDLQMAVAAMRNGATELIEKPFDEATVIAAIGRAIARRAVPPGTPAEGALDDTRRLIAELTQMELAVLRGLVAGQPSKSIAIGLGLSPTAIEHNRVALMQKLGVRSLAELISKVLASDGMPDIAP